MIEMGHEYEDVSKFQKKAIGVEYELVGAPSDHEKTVQYENKEDIMIEQQTDSLSPSSPSEQPSRTTDAAGEDIDLNECIAYSLTTHAPPLLSEQSAEPLYAN